MEIASWAYSDEKIRLHSNTEHSLDHYSPNEEWHLMEVDVKEMRYVHEGVPVSEIHYEISVKRKPLFYMVTLTFPSYVMCATSIVGLFARFSTTGEREERFTLGVSGILTMAVLSLVVSEKVPHSSTSVPLLGESGCNEAISFMGFSVIQKNQVFSKAKVNFDIQEVL